MSKIKVVLNRENVRQLLKSPEMQAICHEQAQAIADRLGDGYEVDDYIGVNRCNSTVTAVSDAAILDNLDNNTLLKGMKS